MPLALDRSDQLHTDRAQYALASQLAVFRACPDVLSRLIRKSDSVLLAAKVLLLSRLLQRKFSTEGIMNAPLDGIWARISRLRRKLLAATENRLASSISKDGLLDAMCGYALASTSSMSDTLRHFHTVRLHSMLSGLTTDEGLSGIVTSLHLWMQTLRDTQALFPRQLSNAINKLKAKPLLAGEDVRALAALDLGIHGAWLGEEIRGFVVYTRHDDLDNASTIKATSSWAPSAFKKYLDALKIKLESVMSLAETSRLRQDCLAAWFSGSARLPSIPRDEVLNGLREAFSHHASTLVGVHCGKLIKVEERISAALNDEERAEILPDAPGLWQKSLAQMDVGRGGQRFIRNLRSSLHGASRAQEKCIEPYRKWLNGVAEIEASIERQRKVKWDDLADDYDAELDEEESRDHLLNKVDPAELESTLSRSLRAALDRLQESIVASARAIDKAKSKAPEAAFLLRVLRAISELSSHHVTFNVDVGARTHLQAAIAEPVVASTVQRHSKQIGRSLSQHDLALKALWSGNPELPILPSPWAFRLLKTCQSAMDRAGPDLWAADAVAQVKKALRSELAGVFAKITTESAANGGGNGDEAQEGGRGDDGADGNEERQPSYEALVQQLYDLEYLKAATDVPDPSEDGSWPLEKHQAWLMQQSKLEESCKKQLELGARAYWKRTSLLFGLLG